MIYYLNSIFALCILTYSYSLWDAQELLYWHLRKIYTQSFTYQFVINIWNSGIITYWILKSTLDYQRELDKIRPELKASTIIQRMDNDSSFDIQVILAFIVSMQFLRFLLSLQVSRTFGPMIKILGNMFMDVVTFLILFSTILLIFIAIGQLLFENLNQFTSPIDTINTLLTICVGGFAYNMFDTLDDNLKYAGYVYLTVFIFFAAIVLINFLIAILTNTYEILNQVNYGLYLRKVLQLRQVYDYNRIYSSIVYAIPPLNFLFLFTAPFTIYIGTRKFNRIILILEYIPILIISILLFTLISLILSPIAFLLILLSLIKSLFAFPVVSLLDIILRVLSLIQFGLVEPFYLKFNYQECFKQFLVFCTVDFYI